MRFLKSLIVLLVPVMFAACGDDDSGNFVTKDDSSDVSSSSAFSPSGIPKAVPCKTESSDNCVYGTLVDERDGQEYKTIDIAGRTWMAENLNYAYLEPVEGVDSGSVCYDNDPENCEKYGRLYRWNVAVKICPSGWHLPDTLEWNELGEASGSAHKLRSSFDWSNNANGTDDFGFTVLPAGAYLNNYGGFVEKNVCVYYWTSTTCIVEFLLGPEEHVHNIIFDDRNSQDIARGSVPRTSHKFSVRCVKD